MLTNGSQPLLQRRFRTNENYEFVPFRRLAVAERALFVDLTERADHVGILRPLPGTALSVKNATRDIATLARFLRRPGYLPNKLRFSAEPALSRDVASLVLDGVLELDHNGEFYTGADASEQLLDPSLPEPNADDPIFALSQRALKYADSLDIDDAAILSARLYFYNRQPTTPAWAHRLASASEVERFLGVDADGSLARTISRHWNRAAEKDLPGWIHWSSRFRIDRRDLRLPTYKLYLSPAIHAIPDALRAAVPILAEHNAPDFKVGSDLFGLVRPDKVVMYFDAMDPLLELARALLKELSGIEGHGVPFTAGFSGTRFLSWGMDPPRALKLLKWRETESWRLWVTNRLALYIIAARRASSCPLPPWHYALARLRFEGVDISSWTPNASMWSVETGSTNGDH